MTTSELRVRSCTDDGGSTSPCRRVAAVRCDR
jgi:hypothetical protein